MLNKLIKLKLIKKNNVTIIIKIISHVIMWLIIKINNFFSHTMVDFKQYSTTQAYVFLFKVDRGTTRSSARTPGTNPCSRGRSSGSLLGRV
jgi:hypothetical protein